MARLDASRLSEGGGTIVRTPAEKAAIAAEAARVAASAKENARVLAQQNALNKAVANNPLTKIKPAPMAQQIGPMTGPNLGRDAAYAMGKGVSLSSDQKKAGEDYNVSQGLNPDGSKKEEKKEIDPYTKNAYAILEDAFRQYGLESLVPVIRGYMENDLGVEQAKLKLKTEEAYKQRFKGNELRRAKGLNVIDEASYLELENDYSETLRAYGLSDYFGVATDASSRLARQEKMADVIGNDISAVEFKTRVSTAVSRVKNADTNTKDAFKALYGIGDTELVKYFLDPTKGSEELKTKATAAEISGAAVSAGLSGTSIGTAEELAKLGVDKSTALEGYSNIAGYLPQAEFFSQIYDESGIKYDRAAAEAEVFKGTASAKRKREQLAALETASFSGSSGRMRTGRPTGNTGQF